MNLVDFAYDRKLVEKQLAEPTPQGVDVRVDDIRHNRHIRENYFISKQFILKYHLHQ